MDHLHIRGENKVSNNDFGRDLGSPPHTWRKLNQISSSRCSVRITSTYVEKTSPMRASPLEMWGSPPHMWRKQLVIVVLIFNFRITSTYVAKTLKESHR